MTKKYDDIPTEHVLLVLERIREWIASGAGTFRGFNDHMDLEYSESYCAGGMDINNAIVTYLEEAERVDL